MVTKNFNKSAPKNRIQPPRIIALGLAVVFLLLTPGLGLAAVPVVEGYQATANDGGNSNTITLVAPTGIQAGELLLIIVGNDSEQDSPEFTTGSVPGWNMIGQSGNGFGGDGGSGKADAHIAAYRLEATGSEGNVTVTSTTSEDIFGWYIRISGADTTTPINVSNFTESGDTNSHVIPGVTTDVDNTLAIYGLAFNGADGDPYTVSGTGWEEQDEQQAGTTSDNGSGCWGTKTQASQGATGNATVSASATDGAAYFQLAINPGNSGPTAALSDTLSDGATEAEIVSGGQILVITLAGGATWDGTIGADNAKTTALIDGLVSDGSDPNGWNNLNNSAFDELSRVEVGKK